MFFVFEVVAPHLIEIIWCVHFVVAFVLNDDITSHLFCKQSVQIFMWWFFVSVLAVFFAECASLETVPRGKWYCKFCQNMFQREKFVAFNANAIAAGRVSGVDVFEQITERCIRIVKNSEEAESIACVLCRLILIIS